MAKLTKAQRSVAAKKGWRTRRRKEMDRQERRIHARRARLFPRWER